MGAAAILWEIQGTWLREDEWSARNSKSCEPPPCHAWCGHFHVSQFCIFSHFSNKCSHCSATGVDYVKVAWKNAEGAARAAFLLASPVQMARMPLFSNGNDGVGHINAGIVFCGSATSLQIAETSATEKKPYRLFVALIAGATVRPEDDVVCCYGPGVRLPAVRFGKCVLLAKVRVMRALTSRHVQGAPNCTSGCLHFAHQSSS